MKFTTQLLTLVAFLAGTSSIVGCGLKTEQTSAQVLDTVQRPDISDDGQSVNITAGTPDHVLIKASELKALVSGIPNPDTGKSETLELQGQFIFRVAQNPRTNLVAIGVRGLISYETDYSMVFVINPAAPNKPQLVKFVMTGKKPASDGSTPAFGTIRKMHFDDSGLLHIEHGDQSDSRAEIVVNHDLSIRSCRYLEKVPGSAALCGE